MENPVHWSCAFLKVGGDIDQEALGKTNKQTLLAFGQYLGGDRVWLARTLVRLFSGRLEE